MMKILNNTEWIDRRFDWTFDSQSSETLNEDEEWDEEEEDIPRLWLSISLSLSLTLKYQMNSKKFLMLWN